MDAGSVLEAELRQLSAATEELARQCGNLSFYGEAGTTRPGSLPHEVSDTKRHVLALTWRLQNLLTGPGDLIQHFERQVQLMACLQWLAEFQVLAFIPLTGSVFMKDIADLTRVPEAQLRRIVRITATAGFLSEPEPDYIAHTSLSAPFVTKLWYRDAAMFLAETTAPAALHMAAATRRRVDPHRSLDSAYMLALKTSQTFNASCEQSSKLRRQWLAYLKCVGHLDDGFAELLDQLQWQSLGNACIVDVDAPSAALVAKLATRFPALHFVVQMRDPPGQEGKDPELDRRILVQRRATATVQQVKKAAVYILRPRPSEPSANSDTQLCRIRAELKAHVGVLRANPSASLILVPRLLPEPGSVPPNLEMTARVRDLSLLQLSSEGDLEFSELVELVGSFHDGTGRLVVADKMYSSASLIAAVSIRYQLYVDTYQ
ncbi:putative O-methyltransferase domain-containing protein [Seiridium unicorne]|uniref:O-methyltransferase domain-containing protein n=1 Tax=Seiridium unicorne TaxID=138068 RepID=A0ABR2UTM2_9PEZI